MQYHNQHQYYLKFDMVVCTSLLVFHSIKKNDD